ncbi:A/G-specific adenine glycosylase [Lottiidibacillus patelloidae]|uniref:Adenine DNA glycosylase n=1 Tax=Lottiidibacillus patelloidae TaxID=2670334 RepID=A0A263BTN0_9BACI|nr:A/G-specific adenine glycosylase [Lottiidibacillus patelloidae]OZM57069.1 A/G-specific adenine glycosylase [Lottiidibacillus patelloidae]
MNKEENWYEDFSIEGFQTDLISWFENEQRILPWRENKDPYRVWVSEIMLQQTKVDTVIPYYNRFMELFPTTKHLAEAEEERVLKAWEGLGYYSRARNLQAAVREVVERYGGTVPNDPEKIANLKGVGPYTTGAISSIAYDLPEPAVDGNVMRVLSRVFFITEDIAKQKTRKLFEEIVRTIISKDNPSAFNQGLMELGALICTPKSPSCLLCPVQEHCKAFAEGVEDELPIKSKKKAPRPLAMAAIILTDEADNIVIHRRPESGLLANLWELPNHETQNGGADQHEQLKSFLHDEYSLHVTIGEHIANLEHIFSHIKWNIAVYVGKLNKQFAMRDDLRIVNKKELEKYPFPVSHQKIIASYYR